MDIIFVNDFSWWYDDENIMKSVLNRETEDKTGEFIELFVRS